MVAILRRQRYARYCMMYPWGAFLLSSHHISSQVDTLKCINFYSSDSQSKKIKVIIIFLVDLILQSIPKFCIMGYLSHTRRGVYSLAVAILETQLISILTDIA